MALCSPCLVVALKTTKVEFIAVTKAVKESLWMKGLVNEMEFKQGTILVHCDNQSNFHLTKHQVFHNKSKHIDVKLHFIRDMIAKGSIKMRK